MQVQFSPTFDRQFTTRLTSKQKIQALEALNVFIDKPFDKDLRNHELKGKWSGYRSISFGGDLRLHFKLIDSNFAYFVAIGSHKQLYK